MRHPFKSESVHTFKVYYQNVLVKEVTAHSRWQAEAKVYDEYKPKYPHVVRSLFKAKK